MDNTVTLDRISEAAAVIPLPSSSSSAGDGPVSPVGWGDSGSSPRAFQDTSEWVGATAAVRAEAATENVVAYGGNAQGTTLSKTSISPDGPGDEASADPLSTSTDLAATDQTATKTSITTGVRVEFQTTVTTLNASSLNRYTWRHTRLTPADRPKFLVEAVLRAHKEDYQTTIPLYLSVKGMERLKFYRKLTFVDELLRYRVSISGGRSFIGINLAGEEEGSVPFTSTDDTATDQTASKTSTSTCPGGEDQATADHTSFLAKSGGWDDKIDLDQGGTPSSRTRNARGPPDEGNGARAVSKDQEPSLHR